VTADATERMTSSLLTTSGARTTVPVEDLVEHLSMISDAMLVRDIHIFQALAGNDRAEIELYHRLRRKHPDFRPGSWDANSHRKIIAEWRRLVEMNRKAAEERSSRRRSGGATGRPARSAGSR
jgi:hypothetical protein